MAANSGTSATLSAPDEMHEERKDSTIPAARRIFKNTLRVEADGNRVYGLDIMRAAAIFFVLLAHGDNLHKNSTIKQINQCLGFDGVSVFFVLSGFLIGGILIKVVENRDYSPRALLRFWRRRWLRTVPAYFLVLGTLIFLETVVGHTPMLQHSKRFFVFFQNFYTGHPYFFQEAWSLSIEEWFYIFVPVCIFVLAGLFKLPNKPSILIAVLLIALFSFGFRCYRYLHVTVTDFETFDLLYRKQVVTRLDSLLFGVLGSYLAHYEKSFWQNHKRLLLLLGLFLLTGMKIYYQLAAPAFGFYTVCFP